MQEIRAREPNSRPRGPQPISLRRARELALAGMCVALGIVLPWFFHLVGGGRLGSVLLPMFLPVLLAGLLIRPGLAALVGLLTPAVSSVLTGMPPPLPVLPMMMAELGVLGAVAGLLRSTLRLNVWWAGLGAVVCSRATMILVVAAVGGRLGIQAPWWVYAAGVVTAGLPGVALLLALVPPLALAAQRASRLSGQE